MKKFLMTLAICCACLFVLPPNTACAQDSSANDGSCDCWCWGIDGLAGGYDYAVDVAIQSWNWVTNWVW